MPKEKAQITSNILMVRPSHFGYNEETAESNAFQTKEVTLAQNEISELAVQEFDKLVQKLRQAGISVFVTEDTDYPVKPDAVFPNNWVTFHENGLIVTYPMMSSIRRMERRDDILAEILKHFSVEKKIQLEEYETIQEFLEGTGSMIIDRPNGLVYACLSPRTSPTMLDRFCKIMRYEAVPFRAVDAAGNEIYHTNVMMALGESFVVICLDAVPGLQDREMLTSKFIKTSKVIIEISLDQMMKFAGNMLQLKNKNGESFLVMSERAFKCLDESQVKAIERHTFILSSPIPTIETYSGGSVRCMMAEIFLPER
jgi:hypothetical protein